MRLKILKSFGIIVLILIVSGLLNSFFIIRINSSVEEIVKKKFIIEQKVQIGHLIINKIYNKIWDTILLDQNLRGEQVKELDELAMTFYQIMDYLSELFPDRREEINDYKRDFQTYYLIGKDIQQLPDITSFQNNDDKINKFKRHKQLLVSGIDAMFATYKEEFANALTQMQKEIIFIVMLSTITSLVGLIVAIILSLTLSSNLVRPILNLTHTIKQLTSGHKNIRANEKPKDEIGRLGVAFNKMTDQLVQSLHNLEIQIAKVKQTEQELRFSNVMLKTQQETSLDGILVIDTQGMIVLSNKRFREMWQISDDTIEKRDIQFLFSQMEKHIISSIPLQFFDTGKELKKASVDGIKTVNGHIFDGYASMMIGANGENYGKVWYFRDITARVLAEEKDKEHRKQLIQADKMASLGILVSGIAHEINNPNQFIISHISPLKNAWEGALPILEEYHNQFGDFKLGGVDYLYIKEKLLSIFDNIETGSNRIKLIVDELKNFVKDQPPDYKESVDINAIVESSLTLVSNMIKKSTDYFVFKKGQNIPVITGNYQRLEQVIVNLLQNACQALHSKKDSILVKTDFDKNTSFVFLIIKDSGIGVNEDHLSRLIDPFYTTKREIGGTGLGLSISSSIIDQHGGTMKFDSSHKKGMEVTITLPLKYDNHQN
ncbi:MAG: HAMP domain-containing protein [Deltaproteobacteria bacterium]|nr:HAMP domain-containing protein [Deltaproteobacteria bacterium]